MWKVGDRVVIIQDARRPLKSFVGFKGTVNFVDEDGIGVAFDKYVNGHGLGGCCQEGHGWYFVLRRRERKRSWIKWNESQENKQQEK